MQKNRPLRRARRLAVAGTAGIGLLTALVGSTGTAAAGTSAETKRVSTPGLRVALSGDAAPEHLKSVSSVDATHAWAAGWNDDHQGVILRWDGLTWSAVTDPALPAVSEWSAVSAASADDVWAYGSNATSAGGTQSLAHYDGKKWEVVPAAGDFDRDWIEVPIKAVPGRLFKGGKALYTYSDGAWQTFELPAGVDIRGIDALSADDAYATGMLFPEETGHPVTYHWDGETWTLMPQPPAPAVVRMANVAAESPSSVYVAGWGNPPGAKPPLPHVEHWDGSGWHDVTGDLAEFIIEAIRPDGHGGLWAAGEDRSTPSAPAALWHYDGTSWTKQPAVAAPDADTSDPSSEFRDLAPVDGAGGNRFLVVGSYARPAATPSDVRSWRGLIEQTQNSLDLTTAGLAPASTVTHTVRVRAEGGGRLTVAFRAASGQPGWDTGDVDVRVTSVRGGPRGACGLSAEPVNRPTQAVTCDLPAGDHTIAYTLKSGAVVDAWKVIADVRFTASDAGAVSPALSASFGVEASKPVPANSRFLARDPKGTLWRYDGTGNAGAPYAARVAVGDGWQGYTAISALSGLNVTGAGDMVARDASGVLWLYRGTGKTGAPFEARSKVGTGWNMFNALAGAGDLTGDGRADLLARDASGVLWLYQGTGSATAPFAARVQVGAGWGGFNVLAGKGDLTGDGRADLLARDASGVLWLYQGTGSAAAPFAARAKVGTGWSGYTDLLVPGDLTGDGRADILGRDASGALWLYQGTGSATAPYTARAKVGTGWAGYNSLI